MEIIPVHNSIIDSQYRKSNNIIQGIIASVIFIACVAIISYIVVEFATGTDPFYDNPKGGYLQSTGEQIYQITE